MIYSHGLSGLKFEFGAKLRGRRFELPLMKVHQARIVMSFRKMWIQLQCFLQFAARIRIVLLLGVSLAEKKMHRRITCILQKQPAKNIGSGFGLTRADQRRAPGKQQPGIIRRILERGRNTSTVCRYLSSMK